MFDGILLWKLIVFSCIFIITMGICIEVDRAGRKVDEYEKRIDED